VRGRVRVPAGGAGQAAMGAWPARPGGRLPARPQRGRSARAGERWWATTETLARAEALARTGAAERSDALSPKGSAIATPGPGTSVAQTSSDEVTAAGRRVTLCLSAHQRRELSAELKSWTHLDARRLAGRAAGR